MGGVNQQQENFFAAVRLSEARAAILRDSRELLAARARVEKYRDANPERAKQAYAELLKLRDRLVSTLGTVQLVLLELEEAGMAKVAGQLRQGLSGFNLMSTAYRPVYEALTGYAEKLPETADTVNARIAGRLMNNIRMGYYPTDPANIAHILRGLKFPPGVTTNVFDPCCGCGKALRQLAQGNNCYAYGVELDEHRAEEAQTRLHRVAFGSFFRSRISMEAFHLMLLNPPYLSVLTPGGGRARHEKRFLVESLGHLMIGGVLIYIIPFYRLTEDVCRILGDNFDDLSVWRFTDEEFQKFKQIAVIGIRKRRTDEAGAGGELAQYAARPESIPSITEMDEERYAVPDTPKKVEQFKGEIFNEKELERQLSQSDSIRKLMNARSELDRTDKHPLLPLSIGQIGLVGGSGMINGLIQCDTPHIIKGRIVKVRTEERNEHFSSQGIHIGAEVKEVISNKMVFNVLTPQGFKSLT